MLMQHLFLYFLPLNTCIQLLHSLDYTFITMLSYLEIESLKTIIENETNRFRTMLLALTLLFSAKNADKSITVEIIYIG